LPVCPVFAAGLDGKCGTGEQRPQDGPDRDRPPAAAAPVEHLRCLEYPRDRRHRWANPAEIKRQFGGTVDFVGDNRVIFNLGGNKYRLIVRISFEFGRVLVKFIGTHAEYDRVNPETVSWRRK
jgi:mRNA interferase HigB